jgi:ribosome maturation factor RimP
MKKLDELSDAINKALKEKEIVVDEITTSKKGKYNFLTIVLDKIGGIDLEAIVDATNIINPIVDKFDICDDSYILDIISKERGESDGQ